MLADVPAEVVRIGTMRMEIFGRIRQMMKEKATVAEGEVETPNWKERIMNQMPVKMSGRPVGRISKNCLLALHRIEAKKATTS